uniref:class I SAM-dependent methyltransferase n=1 Tax=Pararhizobium sp. IMCC3301 TaxID=3067904 RepID=UPI00274217E3|nr:class I SAM-dependent methyltransferase [Pararhizobium sp. IMCC3301]
MWRATEMAHLMLRQILQPGDVVVDATVGNGHDTLFLADEVGPTGRVFGFDVQESALQHAADRLGARPEVTLLHAGHETLAKCLADCDEPSVAAVVFNLGYLPGADKTIMTRSETTLAALQQALALLKRGGAVTMVLYPGHTGGGQEAVDLFDFAQALAGDFSVSHYQRLNALGVAPELLVFGKTN